MTHHHVEIHVETHYSIETLSEKVRFDYLDRSYKRRKNVPRFQHHNLVEAVLTSTHNLCFEQKYEKHQNFLSENFHFLVVKFLVYLNRRVFVMHSGHMMFIPRRINVDAAR